MLSCRYTGANENFVLVSEFSSGDFDSRVVRYLEHTRI